jgi:sulfopyruvate decarboxylase TPP-binding subunit
MPDNNTEIEFDFAIDENKLREVANSLKTPDQLRHLQKLRDEFDVDISAGELLVGNEFAEWLENIEAALQARLLDELREVTAQCPPYPGV